MILSHNPRTRHNDHESCQDFTCCMFPLFEHDPSKKSFTMFFPPIIRMLGYPRIENNPAEMNIKMTFITLFLHGNSTEPRHRPIDIYEK